MARNSFSNSGISNSQGVNGNSGASPASRIITGERLGSEHWWWLA